MPYWRAENFGGRFGRAGARVATAASGAVADGPQPGRRTGRRRPRFHAVVALIILAFMIVGFGVELPKYVLHPRVSFPPILLYHSIAFIGWMLLYVVQTLLIQARQVRLHRTLGLLGVALALVMPPLGIATAIIMRRFDILTFHSPDVPHDLAFLATTFADILAFTPCAWLGIALRKRPEYHRRLMFLSIASIAEAGFGRLPFAGLGTWFYIGNLPLFAAGVIHDRLTRGHVHPVFRWGVPLILLDEGIAMTLWLLHPAWWVAICRWMTGIG